MNNFIKARPAKKPTVQTSWENTFKNGLAKVEGILTSSIKLKNQEYFWAFFQLEGITQDIPVIFKLDSSVDSSEQSPPYIPLRAKVLLEGKWADMSMRQTNSTRPSFTCLAWQIISNPPPITIKSLREQINHLLNTSKDKKQEWQQRTDQLFKKLETLKDLEKLAKLGVQYLQAYLLLKSASYANYQDNLLPHTSNLIHQEEYLAKISSEIEEIAQHTRAYQSKESQQETTTEQNNLTQFPTQALEKELLNRQKCSFNRLTCTEKAESWIIKSKNPACFNCKQDILSLSK